MPRFWALIENDRGLDLFKLQLLVFTVLIATYVAARVVRQSAFPELENEFLLLMGVSNSLYVGSKVAQASPFAVAEARKVELDLLRLQVVDLTKLAESLAADDAKLAKEVAEAAADQALAQKKKTSRQSWIRSSSTRGTRSQRPAAPARRKRRNTRRCLTP